MTFRTMLENYGFICIDLQCQHHLYRSISLGKGQISIASSDFAACRLQVRDHSEFHLQVSVRGSRIGQVVFRRSSAALVDTLDVWDDDGGTLP